MRKICQTIKLIVVISTLSIFAAAGMYRTVCPGKVLAQQDSFTDNPSTDNTIVLEEEKELATESAKPETEVPAEKLVPKPTPTPVPLLSPLGDGENENFNDKRSWTRFKYRTIIQNISERYNLDPQLIYATIMTESEGDEYAYRYEPHLGEASLCMGQILVSTARALGFEGATQDLYKPYVCIDLVGKYHRNMLDTFGDLTPDQLATAYNTGSPWGWPVWGHIFRFNSWYNETVGG